MCGAVEKVFHSGRSYATCIYGLSPVSRRSSGVDSGGADDGGIGGYTVRCFWYINLRLDIDMSVCETVVDIEFRCPEVGLPLVVSAEGDQLSESE